MRALLITIGLITIGLTIWVSLIFFPLPEQSGTVQADHVYVFSGVQGPSGVSVVDPPLPTPIVHYSKGTASRLAILLTDPASNWLRLAHGLKTIGVPFLVTEDYRQALRHRVVLAYPTISGRTLSQEALKALAAFPRNGGTLIGVNVLGGGLNEVFGFREVQSSSRHFELRLNSSSRLLAQFTDPKERMLRLGDRSTSQEPIGSLSYIDPKESPIAVYEDGTAAITHRSYSQGRAIAFGLDIGFLLAKGYNLRDETIAESYDNRFEPMLDVFLRLLREIYRTGEPDAITLGTVPDDRSLSILLTHDIDASTSMANAIQYAEFERDQGITGTYFIQTKYVRDYNDDIFFNEQGIRDMQELTRLGMELGSHTVAHSKIFSEFPLGTGTEQYPSYLPYVKARRVAYNGTVLGELRVSKFLIERFSPGHSVISFRPGELSNPQSLPQALISGGYRFSSSATANNSLTHFPYQLTYDRRMEAEVGVFEFPVTLEDEELPELGSRLPQALELAHQIGRYGGTFVVLIHPNILGHKLDFERKFVAAVHDIAWFGSVREFGHWWAMRNQTDIDVQTVGSLHTVTLSIPGKIEGLVLQIPSGWILKRSDSSLRVMIKRDGHVILEEAAGTARLVFETPSSPTNGS
ncbi:MAG: hypothetical protein AB7G68_04915 [Nitrospiraceae bacterium]